MGPAAAPAAASGLKGAARGSRVCEGVRSLKFELTGEKFRPAGPVGPLSGLFIQPGKEEAHVSADEEASLLPSKTPPSARSSPQSTDSVTGGCGLSGTDNLVSAGTPSELGALTHGEETNEGGRSASCTLGFRLTSGELSIEDSLSGGALSVCVGVPGWGSVLSSSVRGRGGVAIKIGVAGVSDWSALVGVAQGEP